MFNSAEGCTFLCFITLVVIATSLAYQFSRFIQLPYSSGAYHTRLEQLLKYQQLLSMRLQYKGKMWRSWKSEGCRISMVRALVAEASGPGFDSWWQPRFFIFFPLLFPDPFRWEIFYQVIVCIIIFIKYLYKIFHEDPFLYKYG